jgi:muramoyltetrapeptide carboxypeptidase
LLDRIDWPLVGASVARGVRWIGYSDFTAFQLALLARTGASSYAGPGVSGDFGQGALDPYMLEQFDALLGGRLLPVEWTQALPPEPGGPGTARPVAGSHEKVPAASRGAEGEKSAARPALEGILWGGNLSMVASLTGTPYLPDIDGGLLFLEDVAEHPYRVERMLHQLMHAGVLERQRAILLGEFTDWRPAPHDNGYDLRAVIDYFRARLPIPIVEGLPFGHVPRKATLGQGLRYRLERDAGKCRLIPESAPAEPASVRQA